MSRWRSIWLVARREILERGRSRGFILSVAVHDRSSSSARSCCPPLLFGGDDVDDGRRRRAGAGRPRRRPSTRSRGAVRPRGRDLDPTRTGPPPRRRSTAGEVEAVIDVPADLSAPGEVVFQEETDQAPRRASSAAPSSPCASHGVLADERRRPGGAGRRPARRRRSTALDPQTEADQARFLFANIGAVLILVGIFSFGFTVLTGVVEEKQSRVVEVVLSTVRPRDLLMGKVLGIGDARASSSSWSSSRRRSSPRS